MPDDAQDLPKDRIRAVPLDEVRRARGDVKVAMPRSKVASLRAFRRVRADRTFGALGILLLLVGVALIFAWEKPPEVEKKYGVDWVQSTFKEPERVVTERVPEGSAARVQTYDMQAVNATAIIFTLTWNDQIGDQGIEADELELDIKGPPGVNVTNATIRHQEKLGNITIPLGLSGIPEIASVNADTEAKALRAVGDQTNRTGVGTWTYSVRVIRAPGNVKNEATRNQESTFCDPRLPPNANCDPDGWQDYKIHISYVTYSMKLKKLF